MDSVVQVDRLRERHPVYADLADEWRRLRILYQGGGRLLKAAAEFLRPRPNEPASQFAQRQARLTYQNILGSAIGWYLSALFRDGAQIDYTGSAGAGRASLGVARGGRMGAVSVSDGSIYAEFIADADRAGRSLFEVARDCFEDMLLTQRAYLMIDFPRSVQVANRLEERRLGLDRPHVLRLPPEAVVNWGEDQYGRLEWLVVENVRLGGVPMEKDRPTLRTWMVLTGTEYGVYLQRDNSDVADLVESGQHALSRYGRVPVERWMLPDSLWLGDRVYLPVIDHLNQENTLAWQLFMGNLAMPVVITDGEVTFGAGEASYIKLPSGSSYEWSEPAGTTIEASQRRCDALREEIYRQLYLQAQGRSSRATPAAQSGLSKQLDMAPSRDVLDGFGDVLRPALERLMRAVALAVGDEDAVFTVRGFSFTEDSGAALERLNEAKAAGIPSDSLIRELEKAAALELLGDAPAQVKAAVCEEIDRSAPASQRAAAELSGLQAAMDERLRAVSRAAEG